MRSLKSSWFPLLLSLLIVAIIVVQLIGRSKQKIKAETSHGIFNENASWSAPPEEEIPVGQEGDQIRYGRELIRNTALYFGPKGFIARISNGMNCQNCHLDAGTRLFANPFAAVNATYPRFRERSGKKETIEFRINDCFERSLDGQKPDNNGEEMKAMVAYIKWVGKNVPAGYKPKGSGIENLPYLNRMADTNNGKLIYQLKCRRCHGTNGEGILSIDSVTFTYPPLWENRSYNTSAGMFTLSKLAGFIKKNMPFDEASNQIPGLTNEQAWDVAAYINSKPRHAKFFANDWPDIAKKPVDYPFGPYIDNFSELQHKYGPFEPIIKRKGK
jgi:Cytochrome c